MIEVHCRFCKHSVFLADGEWFHACMCQHKHRAEPETSHSTDVRAPKTALADKIRKFNGGGKR